MDLCRDQGKRLIHLEKCKLQERWIEVSLNMYALFVVRPIFSRQSLCKL